MQKVRMETLFANADPERSGARTGLSDELGEEAIAKSVRGG